MTRKFYIFLIASFFLSGTIYTQDIQLQSFDDPAAIGSWINSTAGSFTVSGSADAAEGTGSIAINYNLVGDQGWGGSVDIQISPPDETYPDLSSKENLSFWYKVNTPGSDGSANWTTKLFVNSTGGTEEWHATVGGVIDDMSGEWVQVEIPFSSFAIPSWLTTYDGVLYLDQIADIQMQIVANEGVTTVGEILIDNLSASGGGSVAEGTLLESFDAIGSIGNWINSNTGSYALSSSQDALEGDGAACLDYILIADLDWGGSVDLQFTPEGDFYPDLSGDEGIRFNFKVTQPASTTNGVNLNMKLFITSGNGETEEWHAALNNVIGDTSGDWQEAKIPFANFSIPNWLTTHDGVLYQDQIHTIELQIVAGTDVETNGVICLDNMTSYSSGDVTIYEGFKINDFNTPSTTVDGWINSTDGNFSITASDDTVEGDSSACLSYNLVADQGWGGSVDMQFLPQGEDTVFTDMTGHLGISFWYKVTEPADVPTNVSFIVKAFVNSTGGSEEWHRTVGGVLADDSGEWVQVLIPFTAFAIPSWLTTYDGVLYPDQISEIQFQILGTDGTTTIGGICFDNLRSYDDEAVPVGTVTPIKANVDIFPNPTSSELYIRGLDNLETIQVFGLNGNLLKTVSNERNAVDVSMLQNGFYILKLYTRQGVYSAKFIKQ